MSDKKQINELQQVKERNKELLLDIAAKHKQWKEEWDTKIDNAIEALKDENNRNN